MYDGLQGFLLAGFGVSPDHPYLNGFEERNTKKNQGGSFIADDQSVGPQGPFAQNKEVEGSSAALFI